VGMSAEERKDIVRRGMEALFNRDGDLDSLDETYAEDYVGHAPPFPDIVGLQAASESEAEASKATEHVTATAATNFISAFIRLLSLWAGTFTLENPALAVCLSLTVLYAQLLHNLHPSAVALARTVNPRRDVGRQGVRLVQLAGPEQPAVREKGRGISGPSYRPHARSSAHPNFQTVSPRTLVNSGS
jgi:hypothetical protein